MISLYESILDSTKSGKSYLVDKLKNNIKHCKNLPEFAKIWDLLGLSIDNYHWGYASGGGYVYNYNHKNIALCIEIMDLKKYPSIFIYDDIDDDVDTKEYVNNIAKTLNMSFKRAEAGWYELIFK